jgi:hypothetical protein
MRDWQQAQMDYEMRFTKCVDDPNTPPKVYENPKDAWEVWDDELNRFAVSVAADALRTAFKANWNGREETVENNIDPLEMEIMISFKGQQRRITFGKLESPFSGDLNL